MKSGRVERVNHQVRWTVQGPHRTRIKAAHPSMTVAKSLPFMALWVGSMVLMLIWLTILPGQAATSVEIEGVEFQQMVALEDTQLTLSGYGLLRYMVFIKAYVGALYLPESPNSDDVLSAVPKRLELQYFHNIKREDFATATRQKIADNTTAEEQAAIQAGIDRLAQMYRDVSPGDRYSLTYIPSVGTELALNGEPLGTIPSEAFARAVFSIWLGQDPIDSGFRDRLLGVS